jgi:hypothetical protein
MATAAYDTRLSTQEMQAYSDESADSSAEIENFTIPCAGEYIQLEVGKALDTLEKIMYEAQISVENLDACNAYVETYRFIQLAFDWYKGDRDYAKDMGIDLSNVEFIFGVPARGMDHREGVPYLKIGKYLFESEAIPYQRREFLYRQLQEALPPFFLGHYAETRKIGVNEETGKDITEDVIVGLCMYCPQKLNQLYAAFNHGIAEQRAHKSRRSAEEFYHKGAKNVLLKLAQTFGQKTVNEAFAYALRVTPNITDFALGAILPKISNMGKSIDRRLSKGRGIETGHDGTIELIMQTFEQTLEIDNLATHDVFDVGVVGLGAIGNSTAQVLLNRFPNSTIIIHDDIDALTLKRYHELRALVPGEEHRIKMADNLLDVFKQSKRIISAVTTPLDDAFLEMTAQLSKAEQEAIFNGTFVIDDSEPGALPMVLAKKLGIIGLKPVGDLSQSGIHRFAIDPISKKKVNWDFGWTPEETENSVGLYGNKSAYGCEFTAISTYLVKRLLLAMEHPRMHARNVRPADVTAIGQVFHQTKLFVSKKILQFAGQLMYDTLESTNSLRRRKQSWEQTTRVAVPTENFTALVAEQ